MNYLAKDHRNGVAVRAERGENTRTYAAENWQDDIGDFLETYTWAPERRIYGGGPTMLYRYFSKLGDLLYVGISNEPHRRDIYHYGAPWYRDAKYVHGECFPSREYAIAAEALAIRDEQPEGNVKQEPIRFLGRFREEIAAQGGRVQGDVAQWFIIPSPYRTPITACRCFLRAA